MLLYQIVLSMKLFKITLFSKIYWQHNKLIILLCLTLQTLCSSKTVKVLAVKGVKTRFFFNSQLSRKNTSRKIDTIKHLQINSNFFVLSPELSVLFKNVFSTEFQ